MSDKLCPFCNSDAIATTIDGTYPRGLKCGHAYCCDCGAIGPKVRTSYNLAKDAPWRKRAIKEWISSEKPLSAWIDRIENEINEILENDEPFDMLYHLRDVTLTEIKKEIEG